MENANSCRIQDDITPRGANLPAGAIGIANFHLSDTFHGILNRIFAVDATLDQCVLVLNRLWQPVHVCGVRRALGLLFLGHAEVVHVHGDGDIRTYPLDSWLEFSLSADWQNEDLVRGPRIRIAVPRIIVLGRYDRIPRKEIRFTRDNVFQRDSYTCQYCGKRFDPRQLNIDHVIPRDKGGPTTWENVVTSCVPCNSRKANKLPHVARMVPLRAPRPPRWRPLSTSLRRARLHHQDWAYFVELPNDAVQMG